MMSKKPIGIFYEHPIWFAPLFAELDRRNVAYERLYAPDHLFDPAVRHSPYALIVNRMSAFPSGGAHPEIVLYVKQYVEAFVPPDHVIQDVKRILAASQADLGSVEYLIHAADERVYYYDVNPLSNFVADAPNILGFDPTVKLVDYILARASA